MSKHQSTHPLPEAAVVTLPENHFLRKLTPIGLIVGVIGLVLTFGLSFMYDSIWSATPHKSAAHSKQNHTKKHATHSKPATKHVKKATTGHPAATTGQHHRAKPQIWGSYLVAFLFFLTIGLGGFFFLLIHFATRAGWSVTTRRLAEFAVGSLPFMALLAIPLFLYGKGTLYSHWMWPDPKDAILAAKKSYFHAKFWGIEFFTWRIFFYFSFWVLAATWYVRNSIRQDRIGGEVITRKLQWWSYLCIFLFAWTTTFAAFDWIMSIDPHWYSTIFGVYFFAGCVVAIHAFLAVFLNLLRKLGFLHGVVTTEHEHDIGKMLFAFMVFWTYIAFSQFMLIWYGNIPEETIWFSYRLSGQWLNLTIFLAVGHFAVPFFFLMSRHIKRRPFFFVAGAIWMLFVHLVDLYWLVIPTLYHGNHAGALQFSSIDLLPLLTSLVAVGGFFLAGLGWWMKSASLVPKRDPRLAESVHFENF